MKSKTTFVCLGCQQQFPRWSGRRPKQTATDLDDLTVSPFDESGTPYRIVNDIFGGREKYISAVKELHNALYF